MVRLPPPPPPPRHTHTPTFLSTTQLCLSHTIVVGTLKGVTTQQLRDLDCRIMLGNTYHLGSRPVPLLPHYYLTTTSLQPIPRGLGARSLDRGQGIALLHELGSLAVDRTILM